MEALPPWVMPALAVLGTAYGAFWLAVVIAVLAVRARDRLKPKHR